MAAKKKTKPAPKKKSRPKKAAIDIDAELSVPKLLERGRKLEEERAKRAEAEATKLQAVRVPVPSRPAAPFHFGYPWWFDVAIPAARREELTALFARFTQVANERGCFLVVAPDTEPERRRAAWDAGATIVELDQLDGQLPEKDESVRLARLERALAAPGDSWHEAVMLLSTWHEGTLPNAIATAERLLARWPDELRALPDAWKERADLRKLSRLAWGTVEDALARPDVENVRMLKTQDVDGLRANASRFAHLTALELSGVVGLGEVILELGALSSLEHLALQQPTYGSGTGTLGLRTILAAPHLQKLRALSLYGYTLTDDDLEALASCDQPLRFLRIQYAGMKPSQGAKLARVASRKRIARLDLKYNDLGPKGAMALFANGGDWTALEVLDFSANEIGNRGASAICGADVRALRWLNLSSNDAKEQLDQKGAETIANAKALGALETLNVYGHPIGGAGVAALIGSTELRSLRGLCTAFPGCSHADILAHTKTEGAPKLDELHIGHPDSTKKKADWSRGSFLSTVRTLNAESIGGAEYEALLACPHFGALEVLAFGGCYEGADEAFEALVEATPPPKLRYLDLNGWKMTPDQAKRFSSSPLGRQLWGVGVMSMYVTPESWRVFYDAGLPLVGSAVFTCDPASENRWSTTFREEI